MLLEVSRLSIYYNMSVLQSLGLAGFRNYSPSILQRIKFQDLTLFWGTNGAGKSTIIEVLRYMTTGAFPDNSEKGKQFIINPNIISVTATAQAQLDFKDRAKNRYKIVRRADLSHEKGKCVNQFWLQFIDLDYLKAKGKAIRINRQVSDVLGLSPYFLKEVVFCSQDNFLWPFSNFLNQAFHKIFDFKKYLSMKEVFLQKSHQCKKQIQKQKQHLAYLKRLYDKDNHNKVESITKMRQIGTQSEQASKIYEQMKTIEADIQANKRADQQKTYLIMQKGRLTAQIEKIVSSTKSAKKEMQEYNKKLRIQFNISMPKLATEEIVQQITHLSTKKQKLQKELQAPYKLSSITQTQIEINSEVHRLKQQLPEVGREDTPQQVLECLRHKCANLQGKKEELKALRQAYSNITLPHLMSLHFSKTEYRHEKRSIKNDYDKLMEAKEQIFSLFSALYKEVQLQDIEGVEVEGSQIKSKVKDSKRRLRDLRQQLGQSKSLCNSKSGKDISGGTEHKKGRKRKESKHETSQKSRSQPKSLNGLEQLIEMLTKQIAEEQQRLQKLSLQQELYKKVEQNLLNTKLLELLAKVGLQTVPTFEQKHHPLATLQEFKEQINQYEKLKMQFDSKAKNIDLYEDLIEKNQEIQQEIRNKTELQKKLKEKIANLEKQTQNYGILKNNYDHLKISMKSYVKQKPFSVQVDYLHKLQKQIAETTDSITQLNLIKKYDEAASKCSAFNQNFHQQIGQLKEVDRKIRFIKERLERQGEFEATHAQLKKKYEQMKRRLDLQAQIVFVEYRKPVERQYLKKKSSISFREGVISDMQQASQVLDASMNRFHKQKMDEVNKFIQQLWQKVYHSEDVTLIQIQSQPKGSSNSHVYEYSVLMEMYANNKKVSMKNHSSIGQKVLASIIIRLALVHAFAKNCPLLTLDDPTNGLDRQHSIKLADQLRKIIEMKRPNNLQMVIASKDQEFIKRMGGITEEYYEVARDGQGLAQIKLKRISEMQTDK